MRVNVAGLAGDSKFCGVTALQENFETPDRRLVILNGQCDEKAFETLVRENTRMLLVYLRSVVFDEAAVDDLFQETMVVAWRRIDDCDLSRPVGPWLRGIASRLVMAHFRKAKRNPILINERLLELVDEKIGFIDAQIAESWEERVRGLEKCVDALPEKYQGVIRIRYLDSLPMQGVAEKLGLSREACKKRLQRARKRIADCLKRKGVLVSEGVVQ